MIISNSQKVIIEVASLRFSPLFSSSFQAFYEQLLPLQCQKCIPLNSRSTLLSTTTTLAHSFFSVIFQPFFMIFALFDVRDGGGERRQSQDQIPGNPEEKNVLKTLRESFLSLLFTSKPVKRETFFDWNPSIHFIYLAIAIVLLKFLIDSGPIYLSPLMYWARVLAKHENCNSHTIK